GLAVRTRRHRTALRERRLAALRKVRERRLEQGAGKAATARSLPPLTAQPALRADLRPGLLRGCRLHANTHDTALALVDLEYAGLAHEIAEFAAAIGSGIEVGRQSGKLLAN